MAAFAGFEHRQRQAHLHNDAHARLDNVGAVVTATDADNDTLTYTLEGRMNRELESRRDSTNVNEQRARLRATYSLHRA